MPINLQEEITKSRGLAPQPPKKEQENQISKIRRFIQKQDMDGPLVCGSPYLNKL